MTHNLCQIAQACPGQQQAPHEPGPVLCQVTLLCAPGSVASAFERQVLVFEPEQVSIEGSRYLTMAPLLVHWPFSVTDVDAVFVFDEFNVFLGGIWTAWGSCGSLNSSICNYSGCPSRGLGETHCPPDGQHSAFCHPPCAKRPIPSNLF